MTNGMLTVKEIPQAMPLSDVAPVELDLTEWERIGPGDREGRLRCLSFDGTPAARALAADLRPFVDVRELRDGLSVAARSHVGQIDIGPLRITIRPKLPEFPLSVLLRYAYGLRDLRE